MPGWAGVVVAALVITNSSVHPSNVRHQKSGFPPREVPLAEANEWRRVLQVSHKLLVQQRHDEAAAILRNWESQARRYPRNRLSSVTFSQLGYAHQLSFRYHDALRAYLEGTRLSGSAGQWDMLASLSNSLASLYFHTGAIEEAGHASATASRFLGSLSFQRPYVELLQAQLAGRDNLDESLPLYQNAIRSAERAADGDVLAVAWDMLGWTQTKKGMLNAAERSHLEAFRLRRTLKLANLSLSYWYLSGLRLRQGRYSEALDLSERALASGAASPARAPSWSLSLSHAKATARTGNLDGAVEELRRAMDEVQDSGLTYLPADSLRVAGGALVRDVYDELVEVTARLYQRKPDPALLDECIAAAVASHSLGLRASAEFRAHLRSRMPPEYALALAELQQAYAVRLWQAQQGREKDDAVARLHRRLTEMEAAAGLAAPAPSRRPAGPAFRPAQGQAVFLFHLADPSSWLFVGTTEGWRLRALPGRGELQSRLREFSGAVMKGSGAAVELGASIFQQIFAPAGSAVLARPQWLLVLDDELFYVPFAALVEPVEGRPVYVIEKRSIRILPGAWLPEHDPQAAWSGPFLGLGDPVYNTADSRARSGRWWGAHGWRDKFGIELTRLPGTAAEIAACSRLWPARKLLAGPEASGAELAAALGVEPAVIHLATHVLASPHSPRESLLALSLRWPDGPELVGPEWISARQIHARLVVMSGCHSGRGEVRRGEGLMGLSRAWLYAGARTVLSTYWPTVDDSGVLIESFYKHWLRSAPQWDAAEALRQAQIEAIHSSGGRRGHPAYWAAYFLFGSLN